MIKKVLILLTPAERLRGSLLLAMMMIMAVMEVAGVASIMPFLAVLGNPEVVETNAVLSQVYEYTGSPPMEKFLFALGVLTFVVILLGSAFKALTQYAMARFAHMRRHSIAYQLLQSYVRQPYEFFLNRNSADLSKSVLSEVDQVVTQVIRPLVNFLAYSLVILLIIAMLVMVDVKLALILAASLGIVYTVIYLLVRRTLSHIGADRVVANKERFTFAGETFGGIKDIKLLGCEDAYLKKFSPSSRRFARHQATSAVLGIIPKYIVEAAAFGAILLVALYLLGTQGDLGQVLPVLGMYALAGYRLIPAMQNVYKDLANLRFGLPALNALYQDFVARHNDERHANAAKQPLKLNNSLELQEITYTYPGASISAIKDLNLIIPAHSTVAFVGTTGAGKTTLVDIILGLLSPQQGRILVDGHEITRDNIRAWQISLGYVPQQIYLTDETVAANIAFGKPAGQIDFQAVSHAAEVASLHGFITRELPQGYDTVVGERGVRLSGGQRQRIGIARAQYHNPAVLILDEATSALDSVTERYVMEAIESLKGKRTIIMIAHRLSTVKNCDIIFVLDDGKIVGSGSYEELLVNNSHFKGMALRAG